MRPVWVGKRQGNRTACLLKSQIFAGEGQPVTDAQIIDLSPSGARIKLAVNVALPDIFQVHIPSRMETRHCKMRWQREGMIGVEFFRSTEVAVHLSMDGLLRRVQAMEATLAQGAAPAPIPAAEPPPAAAPAPALAAFEAAMARLETLERDLDRLNDVLQDHVAEFHAQDATGRLMQMEAKSGEILQTLRQLLPMLMARQAA